MGWIAFHGVAQPELGFDGLAGFGVGEGGVVGGLGLRGCALGCFGEACGSFRGATAVYLDLPQILGELGGLRFPGGRLFN
jgi:hypothetical protein